MVTAAAGLGKTTLLASLATAGNCAWYTVGAEDRDRVVLARGVLEAARLRVPAVDPTVVAPPPLETPALAPGAGSRLSVTLSTLRSVLDPAKRFDPEHFVAHDRAAAWLRLEHVAVDVERFLADARAGLAALAAGDVQAAAGRLAAAEAAYAGEFLEEDPYEDWAVPLREEARGTYVSVAMALAQLARATGDDDGTARYLLRVLARDPYDERAHLQLVSALAAAGRHGDARRMYRTYCQRMAEIDVEPNPFPDARPSGHPGR